MIPLHFTPEFTEGWSDSWVVAALQIGVDTVARTRQRLVEEGLEAALIRKHGIDPDWWTP